MQSQKQVPIITHVCLLVHSLVSHKAKPSKQFEINSVYFNEHHSCVCFASMHQQLVFNWTRSVVDKD